MEQIYTYLLDDFKMRENVVLEITSKNDITLSDVIYYDMDDANVYDLVNEILSSSMFSTNKLVVVKNINLNLAKELKILEDALKKKDENTIIIFFLSPNLKKEDALYKMLKNNSKIQNKEVFEDLSDYIKDTCKKNKIEISDKTVEYLLKRYNLNQEYLYNELDKLIAYKAFDGKITIDDINAISTLLLDNTAYDVVNFFLRKDMEQVYASYEKLIHANEDEIRIIGAFIGVFKLMYQVKKMVLHGYKKDEIATILNLKPGRVYYIIKDINSYTLKELEDILNDLLDLDFKIKSGYIDKKNGLELFLLCR